VVVVEIAVIVIVIVINSSGSSCSDGAGRRRSCSSSCSQWRCQPGLLARSLTTSARSKTKHSKSQLDLPQYYSLFFSVSEHHLNNKQPIYKPFYRVD